ncbi:MAG: glutamate racemase [Candidatus Bathyarchaeia archaeon]
MQLSEGRKAIGLLDSGVGGLTIQRELLKHLPNESTVYFGDTGRAPYGSKSRESIMRFSEEGLRFLLESYPVKLIVLACHTISAVAYEYLRSRVSLPLVEVIGPTVDLAMKATRNRRIGIIGTEALINSNIYRRRLEGRGGVKVFSQPCPLLMPLSEEGWFREPETYTITKKYIGPLVDEGIDTLILGCTHYPPLIEPIRGALPDHVEVIDPAIAVAEETSRVLREMGMQAENDSPSHLYIVTDNPERFRRVGERYLGRSIHYIRLVTL